MAVQTRRVTVEEFDRLVELPENADRLLEYVGEEIVEVVSNPYSSQIAARILGFIFNYLLQHDIGHLTGADGGYMVGGQRYIPDVGYISRRRQPKLAERGYNPNPPDLAVEVLSPTDDPGPMRIKIFNYLKAGTVVWLVDPERKRVEVYAPGEARIVGIDGRLDGGDVLPGFELAVKTVFPD